MSSAETSNESGGTSPPGNSYQTSQLYLLECAKIFAANGTPSVGLEVRQGVVIGTIVTQNPFHGEQQNISNIRMVTKEVGMVCSGYTPDIRFLFRLARMIERDCSLRYNNEISIPKLVKRCQVS